MRASVFVSLVFVVGLGVSGAWFLFLRGDAPPPVDLGEAVAGAVASPAASGADGNAAISERGDRDYGGTWVLDASDSFVGYRVREELAGIGAATAVGRTSTLEGYLHFDGEAIVEAEVAADLRHLQSDDARRDRQLRQQALETDRFPEAKFVLTEPIGLAHVPRDGVTITTVAVGEFTLHGVTQPIEVRLDGQVRGDVLVVVGSLPIEFADYDIARPRAPLVLSVEDHGVMELQLIFRR